MFESLWPTAGWYVLFSFFVFQQQLHGKNFRGSSVAFGLALSIFGFGGMLSGLAYLGFLAYSIAWWTPIPVFVAGTLISGFFSGLLARTQERLLVASLVGFAAWPVSAYLMFTTVPA